MYICISLYLSPSLSLCIYIYIYTQINIIYIYIYIHIDKFTSPRERGAAGLKERSDKPQKQTKGP